ncbi:MAG: sulfatase-like hydrolase/transferase [Candidatus Binatia bacterium]|nr:sulfatase-like hydrolase/transferase [Candidatus Binatia bacterium]MDG2009614.1 sulfatase-like hydrolase/transferase [Candidatus Binatia bacterium]
MRNSCLKIPATLTCLALIEIGAGMAHAQPGPDQCSTAQEAKAAVHAVINHLSHATTPKPAIEDSLSGLACAQSRGAELLALLEPFPPDASLSPQLLRCSGETNRAATRYLKVRQSERARGVRRARGGRLFRRPARACQSVAADDPGLQQGSPWGECLNFQNDRLDSIFLARCLRAHTESFVADIWPTALAPNVVLVIADDMRKDSLPWMPKTLSAIAQNGVNFTNAFSTHPICGPARASMLSGMSNRQSGVMGHGTGHLLKGSDVVGAWMQEGGYRTGLFGKYLHQSSAPPVPPEGWDEWQELLTFRYLGFDLNINGKVTKFPQSAYSTDVLAKSLSRFIRKNRNEPFFAVYAPYAGHAPFTPSPRHEDALMNIDPPRGPNFREPDLSGKPSWVRLFRNASDATDAAVIENHRQQLRSLLALDDAVGHVDHLLERLGLTDNTVVIFVSDQGILRGEHWSNFKFAAYEEVIRIPLSLRYPRRYPSPRSSDAMVITADIAATIASLAGVTMPQGRQGVDLDAVLSGRTTPRDHILIESPGGYITYPNRAIRNDRWKLIASHPHRSSENLHYELYDMEADRFELTNLYGDPTHATVANQLREALDSALPLN